MKEKLELVKELISIVEENNLQELNIEFKGLKVEIKKDSGVVSHVPAVTVSPAQAQVHQPAPPPQQDAEKQDKPPAGGVPVKSPLSGVFYRAPKPGAPPFVNVGDVVEAEQTLCIVEAMKLMNEITAETRCKILQICKENAEVANEGDVLFYVEPVE